MYKLIRLFEKTFKRKYITLELCKEYNCDFNCGEVCMLKEELKDTENCYKNVFDEDEE